MHPHGRIGRCPCRHDELPFDSARVMNAAALTLIFGLCSSTAVELWRCMPTKDVNEETTIVDVQLLRRIAQGDSGALGDFYDRHSGLLFGLAFRIVNDAKEAEDVLQDVFLQLWEKA